jgi:hypothetical protein
MMDSDAESGGSSESETSKLWCEDWEKVNEETLVRQFRQVDNDDE